MAAAPDIGKNRIVAQVAPPARTLLLSRWSRVSAIAAVLLVGSLAAPASRAATLPVAPDTPIWMHVGAEVLLWLHIGGGAAGIVTGFLALASRKGGRIHRTAGKVFFGGMLVCYLIAAGIHRLHGDGRCRGGG